MELCCLRRAAIRCGRPAVVVSAPPRPLMAARIPNGARRGISPLSPLRRRGGRGRSFLFFFMAFEGSTAVGKAEGRCAVLIVVVGLNVRIQDGKTTYC